MSQSIFEKISDAILEARTRLLVGRSQEEVEKFLAQAYTLASLQTWDKYVDVFSEEDFAVINSAMSSSVETESESAFATIKPILEKYSINGDDVENELLHNLERILNS